MLHFCHVQRPATAVTSGCAALVLLILFTLQFKWRCVGICLASFGSIRCTAAMYCTITHVLLLQLAEALGLCCSAVMCRDLLQLSAAAVWALRFRLQGESMRALLAALPLAGAGIQLPGEAPSPGDPALRGV